MSKASTQEKALAEIEELLKSNRRWLLRGVLASKEREVSPTWIRQRLQTAEPYPRAKFQHGRYFVSLSGDDLWAEEIVNT
jgi:hypothetical protein